MNRVFGDKKNAGKKSVLRRYLSVLSDCADVTLLLADCSTSRLQQRSLNPIQLAFT